MRHAGVCVLGVWALVAAGCAADPELARYDGGGRARSRDERRLSKAAQGVAAAALTTASVASGAEELSWSAREGWRLSIPDDDRCER